MSAARSSSVHRDRKSIHVLASQAKVTYSAAVAAASEAPVDAPTPAFPADPIPITAEIMHLMLLVKDMLAESKKWASEDTSPRALIVADAEEMACLEAFRQKRRETLVSLRKKALAIMKK